MPVLGGFEFRVSDFEFNYMPYMFYMVEKASVPSAFSLQPSAWFFHHEGHEEHEGKICVNLCNLWTRSNPR